MLVCSRLLFTLLIYGLHALLPKQQLEIPRHAVTGIIIIDDRGALFATTHENGRWVLLNFAYGNFRIYHFSVFPQRFAYVCDNKCTCTVCSAFGGPLTLKIRGVLITYSYATVE